MAINTVDDIVDGMVNSSQTLFVQKNFSNAKAAGAFQSSWLNSGIPGAGLTPPVYTAGSGYTCSSATQGAIRLTNAALQLWIAQLSVTMTQPGTLILADRLWSCSGMGFAAGTYTVTTPGSLPARIADNGIGVEAWVENFVAAGGSTGSLTLNYLNTASDSKSGVISTVVSGPVAGQLQPIPLAVGDLGISQVTSVVTSATWTSGSFGITLLKRIAQISISSVSISLTQDWAQLGLPKIPNDACLFVYYLANVTTGPVMIGQFEIIDK